MDEELQRYRIEQAERWLGKVRKTVGYSKRLEESAAAIIARADNLRGMDYSAVNVQTSPTPDAIPDAIIMADELGETLSVLSEGARERVNQAARALAMMDDPTEATCLQLYYVDACDSWERVCVKMHYSYGGMMKLRKRALLSAYDVMPHAERDPIPIARPKEYD